MSLKEGKKGQVTIFIIIAILLVAIIVLIFLYYPKLFPAKGIDTKNPVGYIQECIEDELEENTNIIKSQGGSYVVEGDGGYFYKKNEEEEGCYVRYLCYTKDAFSLSCINQEPFLKEHVEDEILKSTSESIDSCFEKLVESYENKGYEVNLERGETYVKILPMAILTDFNSTFSIKKGDESNTYRDFSIEQQSSLYELLDISRNILIWEMNLGDSIPEAYMYNNPYVRVEKHLKADDVKIYLITDINTGEDFRFAVRSLAYS